MTWEGGCNYESFEDLAHQPSPLFHRHHFRPKCSPSISQLFSLDVHLYAIRHLTNPQPLRGSSTVNIDLSRSLQTLAPSVPYLRKKKASCWRLFTLDEKLLL